MSQAEELKKHNRESLGVKLKKGIVWQYSQTMFVTVFNFAAGVIMARLLEPKDFGVFAAVTAITNLLLLQVNFGWPAMLLRAKKLEEPLLSTVFWLMQGVAVLMILLVLCSVSFLETFYGDARLSSVMLLICLQFFIVPFNTINGSLLKAEMRYDLVSRITMIVAVLSTCSGIIFALMGYGVYSLVASGIIASILLTGIMAFYAPWKPLLQFSLTSIKPHFSFTWRLHLNNTLNLLASRIDNMMIGRLVGIKFLGIYVKAFSLGRMPVALLGSNLYQMFFTALSQVRDEKEDSLLMFQKMISALTFAIYLPLVFLFVIGEGFVVNLYGFKWLDAVVPMQIMILGSFPAVISMTCGAFCDAQNLVKYETKVQSINVVMTIAAVLVGSHWGLIGIAAGIAVKAFVLLILIKNILTKGIKLKWQHLWQPVWPNLYAAISSFMVAEITIRILGENYSPTDFFQIVLLGLVACGTYILTWFFMALKFKDHKELQSLFNIFCDILKRISKKSLNDNV